MINLLKKVKRSTEGCGSAVKKLVPFHYTWIRISCTCILLLQCHTCLMGLQDIQWASEISCGAHKLTRITWITKKKKKLKELYVWWHPECGYFFHPSFVVLFYFSPSSPFLLLFHRVALLLSCFACPRICIMLGITITLHKKL